MKMHIFKWLFAIILIGNLGQVYEVAAQTNYAVPVTFSVTSTGINRFIASQWSGLPNNATWSGEYQGLTYSIHLNRPSIGLSTNTIKIILGLTITSTVYNGSVTLTPTLIVPGTTINPGNVIAQYADLHDQIIAAAQLVDPRLRYVVEQALSPITWIMYQGEILNNSSLRWVESADIRWSGLPTLSVNVAANEINFTVTPTVTAKAPEYSFQFNRTSNETFGLRVKSNDLFEIKSVYMWITNGAQIARTHVSATAAYDVVEAKYVAIITATAPNPISYVIHPLNYEVILRRGNSETLWQMDNANSLSGNIDWYAFPLSHVLAVRGE